MGASCASIENERGRERERGSYGERTREGESVVGYRQCLAEV